MYNVGTLSGCGLAYFLALPALASGGVIIGAAFGSVLAYKGIRRAMKKWETKSIQLIYMLYI